MHSNIHLVNLLQEGENNHEKIDSNGLNSIDLEVTIIDDISTDKNEVQEEDRSKKCRKGNNEAQKEDRCLNSIQGNNCSFIAEKTQQITDNAQGADSIKKTVWGKEFGV